MTPPPRLPISSPQTRDAASAVCLSRPLAHPAAAPGPNQAYLGALWHGPWGTWKAT